MQTEDYCQEHLQKPNPKGVRGCYGALFTCPSCRRRVCAGYGGAPDPRCDTCVSGLEKLVEAASQPKDHYSWAKLAALAPDMARAGQALAEALYEEHGQRNNPMKAGRCVFRCHYCDALATWNALGTTEEEPF